jgi:sec-independent protein translocase protein TatC
MTPRTTTSTTALGAADRASGGTAHAADLFGAWPSPICDAAVLHCGAADLQLSRRAAGAAADRENGQQPELIFTGLQQGFMTQVRIAIFGGFWLSFPIIGYQLWRFVAPGLYRQREERVSAVPAGVSPLLFVIGAAFAYLRRAAARFRLLPELPAVRRRRASARSGGRSSTVQFLGTINEYLGLTMKFIVAFGLCFQLPVLLTLMGKAELVSAKGLGDTRKYAVVGILVLAAIVTPPDVVTQVMLFTVVYGLYEISILLVRWVERARERRSAGAGSLGRGTSARACDPGRGMSAEEGALRRIADALERMSPPPAPAPDLERGRRVRLA